MKKLETNLASLHAKLDAVLQGTHDSNGGWHPGLSPRVDDLARRITVLEGAAEEATKNALTWKTAVSLSALGAGIGQAGNWLMAHVK